MRLATHLLEVLKRVPRPEGVELQRIIHALQQGSLAGRVRQATKVSTKRLPRGDEFALLMANVSRQIVWQRADLICQRTRNLQIGHNDPQLGPITVSVGIAIFPEDGASTQAVLEAADQALISSKRAGRNGVAMREVSVGSNA